MITRVIDRNFANMRLDRFLRKAFPDESLSVFFAVIRKKIMKAKSDSGPTEMNQKKPEEIENLFLLLKAVSTPDTVEYFDDLYNRCQIRYGDLKKQLAEDMVNFVEPLRQRILEIGADDAALRRIMDRGKEKAHDSAARTLAEVRRVIGYRN